MEVGKGSEDKARMRLGTSATRRETAGTTPQRRSSLGEIDAHARGGSHRHVLELAEVERLFCWGVSKKSREKADADTPSQHCDGRREATGGSKVWHVAHGTRRDHADGVRYT